MVIQDSAAEFQELEQRQIVLGVVRSPATSLDARPAATVVNMIDSWKQSALPLIGTPAFFRVLVVVATNQVPTQSLAGMYVGSATIKNRSMNRSFVESVRWSVRRDSEARGARRDRGVDFDEISPGNRQQQRRDLSEEIVKTLA